MSTKPKLVVFDLDFTLWPFWLDHHTTPPFKKLKDGKIVDFHGQHVKTYNDVPEILKNLKSDGYLIGIASRTSDPKGAQELLNLLDWDQYFTYKEMYPGSKITHFKKIKKNSGLDYSEMIFFDDEPRNIFDIKKLGTTCILVDDGVDFKLIEKGFEDFAKKTKK